MPGYRRETTGWVDEWILEERRTLCTLHDRGRDRIRGTCTLQMTVHAYKTRKVWGLYYTIIIIKHNEKAVRSILWVGRPTPVAIDYIVLLSECMYRIAVFISILKYQFGNHLKAYSTQFDRLLALDRRVWVCTVPLLVHQLLMRCSLLTGFGLAAAGVLGGEHALCAMSFHGLRKIGLLARTEQDDSMRFSSVYGAQVLGSCVGYSLNTAANSGAFDSPARP